MMIPDDSPFWGSNGIMEEMQDEVDCAIAENTGGRSGMLIYSVWETETRSNLHDIAVHGRVQFYQEYSDFWGKGHSYRSEVFENPTWLDVAVAANNMIDETGDRNHIFLEGVEIVDTLGMDDKFFHQVYRFTMGS